MPRPQVPSVTQVLLLASEAKANHGVAGKGGRNTKPLTETLLIKDIPPLAIFHGRARLDAMPEEGRISSGI